VSCESA